MILLESEIKNLKGLSAKEAAKKLERDDYNELPASKKKNSLKIIFEVLKEPMFLLLVAGGMVYLAIGSAEEAALLLSFVFVIMGITIYQENKTENALDALRNMSSPRALVVRDGIEVRIPGREVVAGDIVILKEGDRVPADAILLWGRNLLTDESLLTGESVPVRKIPAQHDDPEYTRPGGDDLPFLYSGSLAVQGQGVCRVIATGLGTEMGKIGKAIAGIKEEGTPLQIQTEKLVKKIFVIVVILCVAVVVIYGLNKGDWLKGVLSGITLAMAVLPEEFPVVLTIFLALGAWRIAKEKALTRRISAVEILGAATVLCVDKTGTLTENKMSIKKIFCNGEFCGIPASGSAALPEKFHELIEYGILASKKDPFDPMEKALEKLGKETLYNTEHLHKKWTLVEEYPLSKHLLALSHVWESGKDDNYVISAKGAPEAISSLCHLDQSEREKIDKCADSMANEGLRVLGVAKASFKKTSLPSSQHDFDFKFIGLIGLADPVRHTVPAAIRECVNAGIRVVMITGDYPVTAKNIARQIGLENPDKTITGPELAKMNPWALQKKIQDINVFSRVVPEQKLLIVDALKSNKEIVAMTGDGVNDAPALKSAHIGVAMGERGTDVARESADIVLLNDDFSTIVKAVKQGRRIYDNLKKAMAYIVSVHIPIAGISLIPVLAGWPVVLYPIHIVFMELVIDPACSVIFESEPAESGIMKRRPRSADEPLFGRKMLLLSFLQGLVSLIVVIAVFRISLSLGQSEGEARALAFITLIVSNLFLILTNRSWSKSIVSSFFVPNRALSWVVLGVVIFLSLALYLPFLRGNFYFDKTQISDVLIASVAGAMSVLWFEVLKIVASRRKIELLRD